MILLIFLKFRGQTSKIVQEVRKIALETYMCVSWVSVAYIKVLRVIVLGENDVEVYLNFKVYIYIWNTRVRLLKDPVRVPQEGTKACWDITLAVSIK